VQLEAKRRIALRRRKSIRSVRDLARSVE